MFERTITFQILFVFVPVFLLISAVFGWNLYKTTLESSNDIKEKLFFPVMVRKHYLQLQFINRKIKTDIASLHEQITKTNLLIQDLASKELAKMGFDKEKVYLEIEHSDEIEKEINIPYVDSSLKESKQLNRQINGKYPSFLVFNYITYIQFSLNYNTQLMLTSSTCLLTPEMELKHQHYISFPKPSYQSLFNHINLKIYDPTRYPASVCEAGSEGNYAYKDQMALIEGKSENQFKTYKLKELFSLVNIEYLINCYFSVYSEGKDKRLFTNCHLRKMQDKKKDNSILFGILFENDSREPRPVIPVDPEDTSFSLDASGEFIFPKDDYFSALFAFGHIDDSKEDGSMQTNTKMLTVADFFSDDLVVNQNLVQERLNVAGMYYSARLANDFLTGLEILELSFTLFKDFIVPGTEEEVKEKAAELRKEVCKSIVDYKFDCSGEEHKLAEERAFGNFGRLYAEKSDVLINCLPHLFCSENNHYSVFPLNFKIVQNEQTHLGMVDLRSVYASSLHTTASLVTLPLDSIDSYKSLGNELENLFRLNMTLIGIFFGIVVVVAVHRLAKKTTVVANKALALSRYHFTIINEIYSVKKKGFEREEGDSVSGSKEYTEQLHLDKKMIGQISENDFELWDIKEKLTNDRKVFELNFEIKEYILRSFSFIKEFEDQAKLENEEASLFRQDREKTENSDIYYLFELFSTFQVDSSKLHINFHFNFVENTVSIYNRGRGSISLGDLFKRFSITDKQKKSYLTKIEEFIYLLPEDAINSKSEITNNGKLKNSVKFYLNHVFKPWSDKLVS